MNIASRCNFSLDELRYEYPEEVVPRGETPMSWLKQLTASGLAGRYPAGVPAKVRTQIEHEFALIDALAYAPYFLTVHEIVAWARERGILCQGRGSAANSAVCYALGITEVDPARASMLFERFVSRERNEPPDIDVDFEHQRREEVIQHIYAKYGRERAALAASVICYRTRGALRDAGRALGIEPAGVAARRRFRDRARPARPAGAGGKRGDGGAHGDPVGQGRYRRAGPDEGRCAGAGHVVRDPAHAGLRRRAAGPFVRDERYSGGRPGHLRDDFAR